MSLLDDAMAYVRTAGIEVRTRPLPRDTPAEFDGRSITLGAAVDPQPAAFILLHSFGSIVGWSLDKPGVTAMLEDLRAAKGAREADPDRFERALARFRAFEIASSEYAVWVLETIGRRDAIAPYTTYFRADVEAITLFHRCGRAPVWDAFYKQWTADAASGARHIEPFQPRPVPPFTPVQTERQQVKQEVGSDA
jgi:hypothetical protein